MHEKFEVKFLVRQSYRQPDCKSWQKAYAQVETSYQKMNQSLQKMGYLHEEEKEEEEKLTH